MVALWGQKRPRRVVEALSRTRSIAMDGGRTATSLWPILYNLSLSVSFTVAPDFVVAAWASGRADKLGIVTFIEGGVCELDLPRCIAYRLRKVTAISGKSAVIGGSAVKLVS